MTSGLAERVGKSIRKLAQRAKNQEADKVLVRRKGGQSGNQNAAQSKSETNGNNNENDVTIRFEDPVRGNSPSYAMRRLEHSRPDLHAKCLEGELTAHAAIVGAGVAGANSR